MEIQSEQMFSTLTTLNKQLKLLRCHYHQVSRYVPTLRKMQREAKLHGLAEVFSFEFSYLPASSIDGALSVFQFVKGGFISHIILLCVFACFIICVMNEKDNA